MTEDVDVCDDGDDDAQGWHAGMQKNAIRFRLLGGDKGGLMNPYLVTVVLPRFGFNFGLGFVLGCECILLTWVLRVVIYIALLK